MADFLQNLFGVPKAASPPSTEDADFADFAGAPDPTPQFLPVTTALGAGAATQTGVPGVVWTKWYRVWERTSPSDFYQEALILPVVLVLVGLHLWGRGKNKRKAQAWATAHAPVLEKEFSVVGFGGRKQPTGDDVQSSGLAKDSIFGDPIIPSEIVKERTAQEFSSYASGRQNVAFVDFRITMFKRYNPLTFLVEYLLSFFLDSVKPPAERMEVTAYAFDGREKDLVHARTPREQEALENKVKGVQSSYDGFVWAVVNKETMRTLRDDRYDISLTGTKDHPKLPNWATVMSESAEVTDMLLTPELIKAVEDAGDSNFENLIITDQPLEKPQKLNDTVPRKRLSLSLRLPSSTSASAYDSTMPLFSYFLRLPDILVSSAHFRPEVLRRIRATRDDEIRKLKRADDDEKAEERKLEADKKKKTDRDTKLQKLSADEQRKFLEKEREKDQKKMQKKMQKKG